MSQEIYNPEEIIAQLRYQRSGSLTRSVWLAFAAERDSRFRNDSRRNVFVEGEFLDIVGGVHKDVLRVSSRLGRMEIITGVECRRRWRDEGKLRIVAKASAPRAVLADVARRHGAARSQIFDWRRKARSGE